MSLLARPNDRRDIGAQSSIDRFIAACPASGAHLEGDARDAAEGVTAWRIFGGDRRGIADQESPSGLAMASNCWRVGGDHPRSTATFAVRCAQPGKKASFAAAFGLADETHRMDADLELVGTMPGAGAGLAIEIDERTKALECATDDGDHQRNAEARRRGRNIPACADADPQR